MNDCLFCKIVRKELQAAVLHEDHRLLVFMDVRPVNPGHALIVPKAHADDYASTPVEDLQAIAAMAQRVGRAAMSALRAPGFNVAANNGAAAGQAVGHMHLHVIPRFEGDGHKPWPGAPYPDGEMQATADRLQAALGQV